MDLRVTNAQRQTPVNTARMARLARRALRRLHVRSRGALEITFIDSRRMRTLNNQFMRHDCATDVLCFRYDGKDGRPSRQPAPVRDGAIVGEILIAPAQARVYARAHDIPYAEELSRYVLHGLLHWLGVEDATAAQQRKMRAMEDELLARYCSNRGGRADKWDISLFSSGKPGKKRETSRTGRFSFSLSSRERKREVGRD